MLVLSRRPGQSILIGKDIEIVVLGSDGVQVRVGIRAPREVTVLRRELLKQVEEENRRASATNLGAALGQIGAQVLGARAAQVEPPTPARSPLAAGVPKLPEAPVADEVPEAGAA